ncbi:MAG: serine/threonine-protein kinase, partial [Bryobacteraceae bacterium]
MSLQIGDQIGDYEITGVLGAGGMGRVYKVRNVISDRYEAMKVLLPDLQHDPGLADRFIREIKLQATLQHAHIAQLFTASRIDNQLLMFLEFLEGKTVESWLKGGPIPVNHSIEFMTQTLSALEYAHERNIIHRDIKPANMMITPVHGGSGHVIKLMDFGIARAVDYSLTTTGVTMGSVYYMSPEQVKGAKTLDARADIYSAGISLYEMVTGKKPFDGESSYEVMNAHVLRFPDPPRSINPSVPVELEAAIFRAIAKSPDDRFRCAADFRYALAMIPRANPSAHPTPVASVEIPRTLIDTPTIPPAADRQPKARAILGWVAGATAVVAAGVAGVFLLTSRPSADPAKPSVEISQVTPSPEVSKQAPTQTPARIPEQPPPPVRTDPIPVARVPAKPVAAAPAPPRRQIPPVQTPAKPPPAKPPPAKPPAVIAAA